MIHKFFPMVNTFFTSLGYNVLLSDPSSEKTVMYAQESADEETCFPVKLMYGHMRELGEKHVDYIFMPSVRTIAHKHSSVKNNYGCLYMQTAPALIFASLGLEKKGIKLLNPVFDLDMGKSAMAMSMVKTAASLGIGKVRAMAALMKGASKIKEMDDRSERAGSDAVSKLSGGDKAIVIIARNYDIGDNVLNMGIPAILAKRGVKVLPLSFLKAHDVDLSSDYPELYWPFGQHILSGARIVRNTPGLYALYITNHGCGPDTMLSHLFKKEMEGKPYLEIEVDEHFSKVGVITRIEAFLNSLENPKVESIKETETFVSKTPLERRVLIPDFGIYSEYLSLYIRSAYGLECEIAGADEESAALGKALTSTKEYSSYSTLAGIFERERRKGRVFQMLIPSTEGAEADGGFPYVISTEFGCETASLWAPTLESVFEKAKDPELLSRVIAAADIAAWTGDIRIPERIPEEEKLLQLARGLRDKEKGKRIFINGELTTCFMLSKSVVSYLKNEGFDIHMMNLGEYLAFLSSDTGHEAAPLRKLIEKIGSPLYMDIERLMKAADDALRAAAGGNIRYRIASSLLSEDDAVVSLCPRYENAETIIDMAKIPCAAPHIALSPDSEEDDLLRLRNFIHYLKA